MRDYKVLYVPSIIGIYLHHLFTDSIENVLKKHASPESHIALGSFTCWLEMLKVMNFCS